MLQILKPLSSGRILAVHGAKFDLGVLDALCANHDIAIEPQHALCTVKIARSAFGLRVAKLPVYTALRHPDPVSDSRARAGIALEASPPSPATPCGAPRVWLVENQPSNG